VLFDHGWHGLLERLKEAKQRAILKASMTNCTGVLFDIAQPV